MNPEDSKQEPAAPPEASKQPEPTTLQPSRSTRSVYVVHPASKPSVSKPPAAKPSVSRPSVVQPSVSKPSESKPLSAKPSGSKPSAAKPSGPKGPAPKPFAPKRPKKAETSAQAEPSKSKEKVAIQKRAVGRAKVPGTFTDSLKHFCFSPTGLLKILRMILIIAAVVSFVVGQAHETFIAITIQEACIVLFFILIYMVTLQHLLVFLDWTLFDLINSFISAVFLLIVAVLTWQEKERRPLFYIGGVSRLHLRWVF
uniref:MARVEL domain-containing protein n=1 Tax=Sciurus vulgaris TaxID=55149 RepID=A0A8D2E135_SCIVU